MKNYYYNQKTQDLAIYDTESRELLVLERIIGLRVFTSSEIAEGGGDEPNKHWKNAMWNPEKGKAELDYGGGERRRTAKKQSKVSSVKKCGYCHSTAHRGKDCPNKPTGKKKSGLTRICKNCGESGHIAKTCKKEPRSAPPNSPIPK